VRTETVGGGVLQLAAAFVLGDAFAQGGDVVASARLFDLTLGFLLDLFMPFRETGDHACGHTANLEIAGVVLDFVA